MRGSAGRNLPRHPGQGSACARRSGLSALRRRLRANAISASTVQCTTRILFAFLTLVALAYFWRKVPETKGRSLEVIERDLAVDPGAVESAPVRH